MKAERPKTGRERPFRFIVKWLFIIAGSAAVYYLTCVLAQKLALPSPLATPVSIASGVAVGILLIFGIRLWWVIFITALFAGHASPFYSHHQADSYLLLAAALLISVAATVQAVVAVKLIRRFVRFPPKLGYVADVLKAMIWAGPVSCLITPSVGGLISFFDNSRVFQLTFTDWFFWWFGDSVGVIFIIPITFAIIGRFQSTGIRSRIQIIVPSLILLGISYIIFDGVYRNSLSRAELISEQGALTDTSPLKSRISDFLEPPASFVKPDGRQVIESGYDATGESLVNRYIPDYAPHSLQNHWDSWAVLIIGLSFSALLSTFLFVILGRAAVTENEVQKRTEELLKINRDLEKETLERSNAEVRAKESADRISAVVDNIVDAVITINENAIIESFNRAAEKIFGFTAEEVIGKNVNIVMPAPYKHEHDSYLANYIRTGESRIIGVGREVIGQRKDGSVFPVDLAIAEIMINENRLFTGIIRDITERKGHEEELRKFKRAVEEAGSAIYICNEKGIISYVNPSFTELTGFSKEEAVGNNPRILKSGEMAQTMYRDLWSTILKGERWYEEVINRKKNGEFYTAQQTVSPIVSDSGEVEAFIAIQNDISELKQSQQLLKEAKEEAESASRAKSEFLANMSHEIRTPMNAVLGFSELLSNLVTDNQQSRYLTSIQTAGKSLLTLINDILDLSKIEAGKLELNYESVDLKQIFSEIDQVFEQRIKEKGLEFIFRVDDNLTPYLILDESRLRQILLNLVGNAVKFTDSGYVTVGAHLLDRGDDDRVDISLTVEDSGVGIPKDQQEAIFESFTQQDKQDSKKYGGTGLGLTICKRLAEMMNGTLRVKSTLGAGSTFEVLLNSVSISHTDHLEKEKEEAFNLSDIVFEPASILVVDDTASNRNLIRESLTRFGFSITEAENGLDALEKIEKRVPDLILMDIRMPVMDGYETARHLKAKKETRDIPIIVMTASVLTESLTKIRESGFDAFLSKPVAIAGILKEMTRFLPHRYKSTIQKKKKESSEAFQQQRIVQPDILLMKLEAEIEPWIKKLDGVMDMPRIRLFAESLKSLSETHQATLLVSHADALLEYTSGFDVSGIKLTLKQIFSVIKGLKTAGFKSEEIT